MSNFDFNAYQALSKTQKSELDILIEQANKQQDIAVVKVCKLKNNKTGSFEKMSEFQLVVRSDEIDCVVYCNQAGYEFQGAN